MDKKKAPEKEQVDITYLLERIEALEKTTKYQYWIVVVILIFGEWLKLIITKLIG